MLGVLELSVIGGVATLGIRQLRHRRTPNATKAVDMRSDAVALMTDVQALGNDLAHAVDDNYHRLMRTGRAKRSEASVRHNRLRKSSSAIEPLPFQVLTSANETPKNRKYGSSGFSSSGT